MYATTDPNTSPSSPQIYDLNNVPLISGVSLIKWHLPHSIHSEHRSRTQKCPITNHRVEYGYSKIVPLRIVIDRAGNLTECPIEFEVMQEFSNPGPAGGGGGARDEKITLGVVRLNLSEYVEESEALLRPGAGAARPSFSEPVDKFGGHGRQRSSLSGISSLASNSTGGGTASKPSSSHTAADSDGANPNDAEDGVVRRYLMQDSKINSTLKISILMVQIEGERNYVAPALKSAPVFGGIAGIMPGEPGEPAADAAGGLGAAEGGGAARVSSFNKSRDVHELQDMYRRALAASWASQPGELPVDECIEDIFTGGDGFQTNGGGGDAAAHHNLASGAGSSSSSGVGVGAGSGGIGMRSSSARSVTDTRHHHHAGPVRDDTGGSGSGDDEELDGMDTLRPRDMAKMRHHFRAHSGPSDRTATPSAFPAFKEPRGTGTGLGILSEPRHAHIQTHHERRDLGKEDSVGRSRSESLASLATTAGSSERGRDGFKRPKEVEEYTVREDLVAWSTTGAVSS